VQSGILGAVFNTFNDIQGFGKASVGVQSEPTWFDIFKREGMQFFVGEAELFVGLREEAGEAVVVALADDVAGRVFLESIYYRLPESIVEIERC
jgi:hypothetical protein